MKRAFYDAFLRFTQALLQLFCRSPYRWVHVVHRIIKELLLTEELCLSFPDTLTLPIITVYLPLLLRSGSQQAQNKCLLTNIGILLVNYLLTLFLQVYFS